MKPRKKTLKKYLSHSLKNYKELKAKSEQDGLTAEEKRTLKILKELLKGLI